MPLSDVTVRLELWRREAGQSKDVGVVQLLVGRQVGPAVKQGSHVRGVGMGSEWPESSVTGADDEERVAEREVRAVTGKVNHELLESAVSGLGKTTITGLLSRVCLNSQCILCWAVESKGGYIFIYYKYMHTSSHYSTVYS